MDVTRAQAEEWAPWFQALGDPTRILILNLLAGERQELTVGEIVDRLDVGIDDRLAAGLAGGALGLRGEL